MNRSVPPREAPPSRRPRDPYAELDQLRRERDRLQFQLSELERGVLVDRAARRAALNLMEDAIEARRVAQRENAERRRAEADLRDAGHRKDEFLAILAHELRNPLAPIHNAIHLLQRSDNAEPEARAAFDMVQRQVNHMVRLVDDLLDVSRITTGKIELRLGPETVATFVNEAIEASRPALDAAHHHFHARLPREELVVRGDSIRLAQVVANLLENAAKYTEPGGVIDLTVTHDERDVIITVSDNGVGIAASMQSRIFELFAQSVTAPGRTSSGLGIGLTLVKNLVELHGGSVVVHSEGQDLGSEFVVRLPLSVEPAGAGAALGPNQPIRPGLRILVVDDNRDAAESMAAVLSHGGAHAKVVYSGPEALEVIESFRPEVALIDIGMPGMDGFELAHRIRQAGHAITLIAVTGWGQREDRNRTRAAGFDHHLTKPADLADLTRLLSQVSPREQPGQGAS